MELYVTGFPCRSTGMTKKGGTRMTKEGHGNDKKRGHGNDTFTEECGSSNSESSGIALI